MADNEQKNDGKNPVCPPAMFGVPVTPTLKNCGAIETSTSPATTSDGLASAAEMQLYGDQFPLTHYVSPEVEAERSDKGQPFAGLAQELNATREQLQSVLARLEATNRQLQLANEEILSVNEELQGANEDLRVSKEQLELANGQLRAVHAEMEHHDSLLLQLQNDFSNVANIIEEAVVMTTADLIIRQFTPRARALLGLMASDLGRPVSRLRLKVDTARLRDVMLLVVRELHHEQLRVHDKDGKALLIRIAPYRTVEERIDGTILTAHYEDAFNVSVGGKLRMSAQP